MKKIAFISALLSLSVTMTINAFAEDPKAEAQSLVKNVIALAKKDGKAAAIAAINKGQFTKGELYPLAYDFDGKCLAHGTKPARVGQNMINDKDPEGKEFVKERVEIAKKGSGWQKYRFQNPVSKKIEDKEMYIEPFDGVIWGAGAYSKK